VARKEGVSLDFFSAIGTEASRWVSLQQCGDHALRFRGHIPWEL